jgi:hypothetical protein
MQKVYGKRGKEKRSGFATRHAISDAQAITSKEAAITEQNA